MNPVAENCDLIGNFEHFIQFVTYEDDCPAAQNEVSHDLEQVSGFVGSQDRGWFIEDEYLGPSR